ncbi:MAG: glycolate oxidase iron-sulfur subunit [Rhodospirillaceae bacterium]|nr:glycolate oxidase iron-sulfur subunit [Rhodospirillaceae bacterium]
MKTTFTEDQRANPLIKDMEENLRKCVHCGFCLSACPTYSILGDERDSPRGRIYLIKDMLEMDGSPNPAIVSHIDKCLSCLACMSACPSGVHYQHYVDQARAHIEDTFERPLFDRLIRWFLGYVLPHPDRFRFVIGLSRLVRPFRSLMGRKLEGMIELAPANLPKAQMPVRSAVYRATGEKKMRVALMTGCVQQVLRPSINEATIRLLTRLGAEVVVPAGSGCCGALVHHLGKNDDALDFARRNIAAWIDETEGDGLDAIVINASGCGTEVKDYGFMLRRDIIWRKKAEKVSALTKDVSEVIADLELEDNVSAKLSAVIYHDACSLLHGQGIFEQPRNLLVEAGYEVQEIPGKHYCCGSAGSYNLLQPDIAIWLKDQRLAEISKLGAQVIATGNIGCLTQLATKAALPVVHTVELLDWATGGPRPY